MKQNLTHIVFGLFVLFGGFIVKCSDDLPTDEDYVEFLFDYEVAKLISIWDFKGKAQSIIDFAKSLQEARSGSEIRARVQLLHECTLKH
jgi:hypothetical protein